ncbi:VOC family protein [Chryseobacterium chendengshani]|uniref:VOC family protein n=1 Tax=Chryseobacterium sp. LJ668 TaxID=2864040 RepID=UPI001C6908D4|nr:VOC family protein [Chryseobacterium sp. LJ668]MBW8523857.1 VOC family protein [Chryseobacterium sp. LJ668]QYK16800.1 VOC family protein [Chryseobacterium sp. LJ668]
MIQFSYTILYVNDVNKSVSFYATAFGFNKKFVTPDNQYGEVATGPTTLSFATTALANSNLKDGFLNADLENKPFGIEIGFTTDDVKASLEKAVMAGAVVVSSPITKPWGQVVAYVRDIDGFLIEICTPMV